MSFFEVNCGSLEPLTPISSLEDEHKLINSISNILTLKEISHNILVKLLTWRRTTN